MRLFTLTILLFSFLQIQAFGQQVADTLFSPVVGNPAYGKGQGPVILIDEAHSNFHTVEGRFKPFANVLRKDGYVVNGSTSVFTPEQLAKGKVLVIANALHPSNAESWTLPTPSAFTDDEILAVNNWVKEGGSLFLIADHMPFPGAAEKLAASFGFKFYNGFAEKKFGKDVFTPGNGLTTGTITNGRNSTEKVTSLQTFMGQAFEVPKDAQAIVTLDKKFTVKMPVTAWVFKKDTPSISGENLCQGASLIYGKGRVVVFGEAAMFTAQQNGKTKMGMNVSSASQNAQFLLNTIHWLDGLIK